MNTSIAIVGMACCYPDARSPRELWENVLARRRAFRRMPGERLRLADYASDNGGSSDSISNSEAAVIANYEFDRVRFCVSGATYRSADLAHWLALDVSDQALTDAGFPGGCGLPLESTAVLVGNTLTGEFSRAATLRLRWPFVRRVVEAQLHKEGWDNQHQSSFLASLQEQYKAAFAPASEETLAGSLSNTIAGRICNQFHLGGGGYTVDGACCSSLLAVSQACSALSAGDIDAALAGGVDLSLDPFELVGFSRAGALAHGEMLVYDRQSSGFLPGEGSGFVVLMRAEDARARGLRIYALVRGWGISSDGVGGIMRPELHGQELALHRAYQRAGYAAGTVALFEGHGTGTAVGDEVELRALANARGDAEGVPASVGSIKTNIGHTKAAAGIAGLLKATLAVHNRVLPPATGVRQPRPEIDNKKLRILETAEQWPEKMPVRAGVSSFGFGGINVHVTIEGVEDMRDPAHAPAAQALSSAYQDVELFLLNAANMADIARQVDGLMARAAGLAHSEMADLAAALAAQPARGPYRAALVASTPAELAERLRALHTLLQHGTRQCLDAGVGIFLGTGRDHPRIGLLFPGQASPVRLHGGAHARRFARIQELYSRIDWPAEDPGSTHTAQMSIAAAEMAGVRMLNALGIDANVAIGHSLGELAAYSWAGAFDENALLSIVEKRGRHMAGIAGTGGSMASITASAAAVEALLRGQISVVAACFNAPDQVIVAGATEAVLAFIARAQASGYSAALIPAAHAFHSPLMLPAQNGWKESLLQYRFRPLRKRVVSTITGQELESATDLSALLASQLTSPVHFMDAVAKAAPDLDLFLEVGPGSTLTRLVRSSFDVPVLAIDVAGPSLNGLLLAAAAAHVLGVELRREALFGGRFTRPFDMDRAPSFFANPCESVPPSLMPETQATAAPSAERDAPLAGNGLREPLVAQASGSALEVVQRLVAQRTELPRSAVRGQANLLRDLHLNSITVAEIVASAARELGMSPPRHLLEFAGSTVEEMACALEKLCSTSDGAQLADDPVPAGVDDWCRAFTVHQVPRPLGSRQVSSAAHEHWRIFASSQHHSLKNSLAQALLPGRGVLLLLSPGAIEQEMGMLLEGAQYAVRHPAETGYFVLAGEAAVAASFARTLHLENPGISTRVIHARLDSRLTGYVQDEIASPGGHVEAHYDDAGRRAQPCLQLFAPSASSEPVLHRGDVVLVSGGGKGIAAECALALARDAHVVLAILGRSVPGHDPEIAATIEKFAAAGIKAKYFPADVSDPAAVEIAVREIEELLGPVAAIIHAAGRNEPKLLRNLDDSDLAAAFAPKVHGLRNLLAACGSGALRLLVSFSSVIGRVGLRGEAHYALANAALSRMTEEFAEQHPSCRCLALESTAWSELGMAERLGTVAALRRDGVYAITPQQGVLWFKRLLSCPLETSSVVVTGRLGAESPLPVGSPAMPLLRFLEHPRVHYPGVELVADCKLSTGSDPYLQHHVFRGQMILPAVMGLEAMIQAAVAVTAEQRLPVVSDIRFDRPLVVEPGAHLILRVAALVREPGRVEVVLRSSLTAFQMDHFRCACSFQESHGLENLVSIPDAAKLPISPERDLYGGLFFQTGWFRRVGGYRQLNASGCWAEIEPGTRQAWFSPYLPSLLLLGDPAARDAALHSVQACVPHAAILPVAVRRFYPGVLNADQPLLVRATERWHREATYCYDVELRGLDGRLCELWSGLELRRVAPAPVDAWPEPLVAAFLEWRMRDIISTSEVSAVFDHDASLNRSARSERARSRALQLAQSPRAFSQSQADHVAEMATSAAHANGLTFAVSGPGSVACDLEPVHGRSEQVWCDLLGIERWRLAEFIARESGEDLQVAATQVWTAQESLKKANAPHDAQLVLCASPEPSNGSISLEASGFRIAVSVVRFRDDPTPYAVSILVRSEECATTSTATA